MWRYLRIVFYTLCLFVSAASCVFLSTPQSKVIYEGRETTLTCHVHATAAFWRLNGTIYSELNSDYFQSRGITSFDSILGPSLINKTLTIVGSPLSNNTVVNCVALPQINGAVNISEDALITVLGVPSDVNRRVVNSTSVEISWRAELYVPPTVTIQHYSISMHNTSDPRSPQHLQTVVVAGTRDDNGVYSQVFNFDRELGPCTQMTFSVTSISSIGTSPPSNVTWETPIADYSLSSSDFVNSLSCSVFQERKKVLVSFKPPALCPYQNGGYTLSLLKRGGQPEQLGTGSYSGSGGRLTLEQFLTDRDPLSDGFVAISVTVVSPYGEDDASEQCRVIASSPKVPNTGGLSTDPSPKAGSAAVSGGFIGGIVVGSLMVLLTFAMLIGVLMYLYFLPSRTQHTDSKINLTSSSYR